MGKIDKNINVRNANTLQQEFENELKSLEVNEQELYNSTITVKSSKKLSQLIYDVLKKIKPNNNELSIETFEKIYNLSINDKNEMNYRDISRILNKINTLSCEELGIELAYYIEVMKDIAVIISNYNNLVSGLINKYNVLNKKLTGNAHK